MPRAAHRRDLRELDAEAAALLARYQSEGRLPAWLAFYRRAKPTGGADTDIVWRSAGRVPRGVPSIEGAAPELVVTITDAEHLDPVARYIMRLWMARDRKSKAARRGDKVAERAALALWTFLLAHPPSGDRRAKNLLTRQAERIGALEDRKEHIRTEAARMREGNSRLSDNAIAKRLRGKSELSERTIRRYLAGK